MLKSSFKNPKENVNLYFWNSFNSHSWVAASQMWRAGFKVQDAKQGWDCQSGRWWWQRGQEKGDGWLLERVRTLEIISQTCWHFLQEDSSFGEHWLCWHGSARAWPAPCGQCWYVNDWCHMIGDTHTDHSGLPRNMWKVPQTFGRAGRDKKLQAVGIQIYWPGQKGV